MSDTKVWWIDTPSAPSINADMTDAADAFDQAYFQADTPRDLDTHVTRCINALRRVQSAARKETQR